MESGRGANPPATVESVRILLGACLSLLDAMGLHQAAAYVDMALAQLPEPPGPPPSGEGPDGGAVGGGDGAGDA